MCTGAIGPIWGFLSDHVTLIKKKAERWRSEELLEFERMRAGWVKTGLDHLQDDLLCERSGYRELYPEDCDRR